MKKLIFTIITLLILSESKAQYQAIYKDTSTYFRITREFFDAAEGGLPLEFSGDTIIENIPYKKVYFSYSIRTLVGFFREDISSGKAWFYGTQDTSERLIMDLSLEVGDTFDITSPYFYYSGQNPAVVDSVTFIDGRKIITFLVHFGGGYISAPLKFIEGIGPNSTLVYLSNEPHDLAMLTCEKYENEVLVFSYFPGDNDCLGNGGATNSNNQIKAIKVFPNPFSNEITIATMGGIQNLHFQLYDIQGYLITDKMVPTGTSVQLNNLKKGVYVYKIKSWDQYYTGKLVSK